MVVGTDGKVAPRTIKVGSQQRGQWVILDGLQNGDQVMVDGFQKLRGGAPVKPVPWQAPGSATAKSGQSRRAAEPADLGPSADMGNRRPAPINLLTVPRPAPIAQAPLVSSVMRRLRRRLRGDCGRGGRRHAPRRGALPPCMQG